VDNIDTKSQRHVPRNTLLLRA